MKKINSSYKENFVIALQSLNQKIQISLPEYTFYPQIEERHRRAYGRFYVSKSADHYLTIEDAVTVWKILLSKLKKQEKEHIRNGNDE